MVESAKNIIENQPYVTLSNGIRMPKIGLGTYGDDEGDVRAVVKSAILEHGYRHIDTAKVYLNEDKIGEALQEVLAAGIKREELFIVTKLWHDDDKLDVEAALRRQLKSLQLEYIDLYLIHWILPSIDLSKEVPLRQIQAVKQTPLHKVYEQLEALVDAGLIKSIGVSNATIPILLDILTYARHRPVIN
jgi:diketogulonate reductase-like aldo/keto reductase